MKGRCLRPLDHGAIFPIRRRVVAVGVKGFEPPAPCSQSTCATRTALHPVVPVSLACPAGDFLSIHPFQQFVNPQNEFFCGFFDSFWAFFGKSPQMPVFSAFFRFPLPVIRGVFGSYPPAKPSARPCRSAKRRFFTESWGKSSLGARLRTRKIRGRDASLPAPLLAASLGLVGRGTVGALPQTPHGTLSLDPARGNCPLTPFRD